MPQGEELGAGYRADANAALLRSTVRSPLREPTLTKIKRSAARRAERPRLPSSPRGGLRPSNALTVSAKVVHELDAVGESRTAERAAKRDRRADDRAEAMQPGSMLIELQLRVELRAAEITGELGGGSPSCQLTHSFWSERCSMATD